MLFRSLRSPRQTATTPQAAVATQRVIVAARDLPIATLLRGDDIKTTEVPANQVPPQAVKMLPGQPEPVVLGAATERAFKAGDVLTEDAIIRPTDARFLPAVLSPGMRALSLSFSEPELGAGLIQPGDHVDVLLTQRLGSGDQEYRSVGETIMSNLRVIAADRTLMQQPAEPNQHLAAPPNRPIPRTVTLEVTPQQAEGLMVARQLGGLQLTLRGLVDRATVAAGAAPPPTWAAQVSTALRELGAASAPGGVGGVQTVAGGGQAGQPAAVAIDVFRGGRIEQRCYSAQSGTTVPCRPTAPTNSAPRPVAPGSEEGAPPADSGKASALPLSPFAPHAA